MTMPNQPTPISVDPSWNPIRLADVEVKGGGVPIVENLLMKGAITLLSAREKVGKTTLVSHLAKVAYQPDGGEFLGQKVHPSRILYVSEEPPLVWTPRRDDDNVPEEMLVILRPVGTSHGYTSWVSFCRHIVQQAATHDIDLVILDTWMHFNPSESENNNSEVSKAIKPVQMIADAGLGVLLIHHHAKNGGVRGGTALPSAVEMIINMTRPSETGPDGAPAERLDDRDRIFKMIGRFPGPSEIRATWTGDRYDVDQSAIVRHPATAIREERLLATLSKLGTATSGEIKRAWPEDGLPPGSDSTFKRTLSELVTQAKVTIQSGSGGAQDPKIYAVAGFTPRQKP